MLKMSFYDGTMDKDKLKEFIMKTQKKIRYTHGLRFRGPRICDVPIDKDEALIIVDEYALIDANETERFLDINTYSSNDMF